MKTITLKFITKWIGYKKSKLLMVAEYDGKRGVSTKNFTEAVGDLVISNPDIFEVATTEPISEGIKKRKAKPMTPTIP